MPTGHPTHFGIYNENETMFYSQYKQNETYPRDDYHAVGCLLNVGDRENGGVCMLEFTICQASTDTQMYQH